MSLEEYRRMVLQGHDGSEEYGSRRYFELIQISQNNYGNSNIAYSDSDITQ